MPNNQSVFYMLGGSLEVIPKNLWHFQNHETIVSNFIGLPTGAGVHGQSELMAALLLVVLRKGFVVPRKKLSDCCGKNARLHVV